MQNLRVHQLPDALAEGAIAHLVMVLQEGNKGGGRQVATGLAPGFSVAEGGGLTLIGKPFGQATAQMRDRSVGIVGVVAVPLSGEHDLKSMMEIVIPLRRVVRDRSIPIPLQMAGGVTVILQNQVHVAFRSHRASNRLRQFGQYVGRGIVEDGMDGIEPQSIEMIFRQPVEGIVDEEVSHHPAVRPIKVDRLAPGCRMARGEKLRRVFAQVISLRPEVVVDHVQYHHDAPGVGTLDQALQIIRPAVSAMGSKRKNSVVAPIARPGKIGQRHQLDSRHAESGKVVELSLERHEGPLGREGSSVQFVDDSFPPRPALPVPLLPIECSRVHDLAWAMNVLRLKARGRIRHLRPPVDLKQILAANLGLVGHQFEPALLHAVHGNGGPKVFGT